ncbi:hypothetical protein BDZ89DRAFT_213987 [Hymenopellis radicata]|nr:hypothetical protein BDZ89DRAFT_213987 [Hymenopellis radicata]
MNLHSRDHLNLQQKHETYSQIMPVPANGNPAPLTTTTLQRKRLKALCLCFLDDIPFERDCHDVDRVWMHGQSSVIMQVEMARNYLTPFLQYPRVRQTTARTGPTVTAPLLLFV